MGVSRVPHSTFLGSIRILSTWAPRETRQTRRGEPRRSPLIVVTLLVVFFM